MKLDGIPLLSFFTGAGFLDIGFLQRGFNTLWHNENHLPFVNGFEMGISSLGYHGHLAKIQNVRSILEIGPNEILSEAFGSCKVPELFGIIGGPPCPDFSVGGKNRGETGSNGKLSEVYVNRILEINPAFFLFENVPGLLRTSKHREFLANLLDKLTSRYVIDIKILNALDFGVPQDRERVFIVGFRKTYLRPLVSSSRLKKLVSISSTVPKLRNYATNAFFEIYENWFPWPEVPEFNGAKYRFSWPNEPVEKGCVPNRPPCPASLMVGTYICDEARFLLPNSDEWLSPKSSKIGEVLEGDVSRKSFKRLHRYRYSPTAAYGNNEVHLHPTLSRRLSVREAMLLQSVPNEYRFPEEMTLTNKFKTIGNGVPVKLSAAISGAILSFLEELNK
ncbi:DNA cytosine methyltransferase [Shewanella atlantica]|uniref:DNA (cytosine-5-)-methyltransferase n=1 Tax=Shewanella atlantica TaxID=271099 RepID=A0A431W845_9GAMM|nr:DNA cytosine methyltransferase [Shewanella atlantica]RTR31653.1 DNA cytosine methyltransferase [Shewanella atlantica]